jgi:hypothetical protein
MNKKMITKYIMKYEVKSEGVSDISYYLVDDIEWEKREASHFNATTNYDKRINILEYFKIMIEDDDDEIIKLDCILHESTAYQLYSDMIYNEIRKAYIKD